VRQRLLFAVSATVAAGSLTLSACGSRDDGASAGSGGGDSTTVTIGVDVPLTGSNSATGLGVQYGAQIAVDDANKNKTVPGVTFKIEALDDKAQPADGQQNATKLVADPKVLATVASINSGVSQSQQQVFEAARLLTISPGATNPSLTQGADWAKDIKKRTYKTFFRTATTDALQGAYASDYYYKDLKKRKVFVVDDQTIAGVGITTVFKSAYKKLGGSIVGTDHINVGDTDFAALVGKIRESGADALYMGAYYAETSLVAKQMAQSGVKIPLMGDDGMFSDTFIKNGRREGDLATSIGQPVDTLSTARDFVAQYKAKGYKGDYGTYAPNAYDSTMTAILAVEAVMEANNGKLPPDARSKIVDAAQGTDFDGITGHVSFDQFGDTTNKALTVYRVSGGKWNAIKSGVYTG
jgi:branched-chain amino acid transport system substrate-binding protein